MRKTLLLAMSAFLRRPTASAFMQTFRSSRESIRFFASNETPHFLVCPAMSCPIELCSPFQQGKHFSASTTSLNLLSRGISADAHAKHKNTVQSAKDGDAEYLQPEFKRGDQIMVEVIFFGPLGASCDVVGHSHNQEDCISQTEPALGRGMILQSEINFFRRSRGNIDVVKYEILPAYVENVREEVFDRDGGDPEERLDISLRPPGGKAKAQELGEQILEKLKDSGGAIDVGDKSSPSEINEVFPGASKGAFKKAVSGLYRQGLVTPGPDSVSLA